MKNNKKVIELDVIQRLAESHPQMTIIELLEYIEDCEKIKEKIRLRVMNRGDAK